MRRLCLRVLYAAKYMFEILVHVSAMQSIRVAESSEQRGAGCVLLFFMPARRMRSIVPSDGKNSEVGGTTAALEHLRKCTLFAYKAACSGHTCVGSGVLGRLRDTRRLACIWKEEGALLFDTRPSVVVRSRSDFATMPARDW